MSTLQAALAAVWLAALALFISGALAVQRAYEADVIRGRLERELAALRAAFMERQQLIGLVLLPAAQAIAASMQRAVEAFNYVMASAGTTAQEFLDRLKADQ